jgi:hypothetical protein
MAAGVTVALKNLVPVSAFLAYCHVISQILAINFKTVRGFDLAPAIILQVSAGRTLSAFGIGLAQEAIGLAQEAGASTEVVAVLTEFAEGIVAIAVEAVGFGAADACRGEESVVSGAPFTALDVDLALDTMQVLAGDAQVVHVPVTVLALEALTGGAVRLASQLIALDAVAIRQFVVIVRPFKITLLTVPCYASHHLAGLYIRHALIV